MIKFAKALFELCQTVTVHGNLKPMSCLLGPTAATRAVKEIAHSMQKKFEGNEGRMSQTRWSYF